MYKPQILSYIDYYIRDILCKIFMKDIFGIIYDYCNVEEDYYDYVDSIIYEKDIIIPKGVSDRKLRKLEY